MDGDRIFNNTDLCPLEPEDLDGFEDGDGCPEPDNDRDGIPDLDDKCPNEPEIWNGQQDEDGCPEAQLLITASDRPTFDPPTSPPPGPIHDRGLPRDLDGKAVRIPVAAAGTAPATKPLPTTPAMGGKRGDRVIVSDQQIQILERIYFDPGKAVLKPVSLPILNEVAEVLKNYPMIRKLRLEGNTDDRGTEKRNLALGLKRAEAVRNYLILQGIAPERLEAFSWGEAHPIVPNTTAEDRLRNNRVEFNLLDIDGPLRVVPRVSVARVFPIPHAVKRTPKTPRDDFRDTVLWAPNVQTGKDGIARLSFPLSDALTTFSVSAEGVGSGEAGEGTLEVTSALPFSLDVKVPVEVSSGDVVQIQALLANQTTETLTVELTSRFDALFDVKHPASQRIKLAPGERKTVNLPITATAATGTSTWELRAEAAGLDDAVKGTIKVVAAGFPQRLGRSGTLLRDTPVDTTLTLSSPMPGSVEAELKLMPNHVAILLDSLSGMLSTPYGCFEQTSSVNYPNIMVLRVLGETRGVDPKLAADAHARLAAGYERLTGYEVEGGGFDWWGKAPAHETLTAYGLMQFLDMQVVYPVDPKLIERTASWLRSRRDGKGGYLASSKGLDQFGANTGEVREAYVAWALSRTRGGNDKAELARAVERATSATDPYLLALTALTLANQKDQGEATRTAARRLAGMQGATGAFEGAASTIVGSGGGPKTVETTALAALALAAAGDHDAPFNRAIQWLFTTRLSGGGWGTTQGTIMALKAIEVRASRGPMVERAGSVAVEVNGKKVATVPLPPTSLRPLVVPDLARYLHDGPNTVRLTLTGTDGAPYGLDVRYSTRSPQSASEAPVGLKTSLSSGRTKLGESVRLSTVVENRKEQPIGMTLIELGIPAGLKVQRWQLEALQDKGLVAHVEVRPRGVVLYLDGMGPLQRLPLDLDLQAEVPGTFEGPASSAFLYYTPDRAWAAPLPLTTEP